MRSQSLRSVASTFCVLLLLHGCAASPSQFASSRQKMGDSRLCSTWKAARKGSDSDFMVQVSTEAGRRGLSYQRCEEIARNQKLLAAGAIIAAAAVVAIAHSGGGGGAAAYDYDYAWDMFNNQQGRRMVRCRGIQTGQFAEDSHCAGKAMNDYRWPGP
jgi:hypothetical protein